MELGTAYLESVITRITYYKELADKTFEQLQEQDFHFTAVEEINNIAIIIQHMAGNMLSRWTDFLTTDGEKEWRDRDEEFKEQHLSKVQLLDLWEKGWDCFLNALKALTEKDLQKIIYIRKEGLTVMDAINRQLAHYPYHVGQIIYAGRIIRNREWKNLSIPKGESTAFNRQMNDKENLKNK